MSLSSWEHQILGRIAEELRGSDPRLASLATGFNRAVASEEMPLRPQVAGARRSRRRGRYRRRTSRVTGMSWFFMAVWCVTTAALIAVALVLNLFGPGTGGSRGCAQPRSSSCAGNGLGALSVLAPGWGS